jgi:hypothetical protein
MTIDSTWLSAFKEESPHAFTQKSPFKPSAVFVDGQIKLMQGQQGEPQTWDNFIYRQFARHLLKFYDVCDVVVLAFDNYEHVPRAKCMTQVLACFFDEPSEKTCRLGWVARKLL